MKKKTRSLIYTFLKIVVTLVLLYLVFSNIQFNNVWEILRTSNPALLVFAIVSFIVSQWLSAKRLLVLFRWSGFALSSKNNYILYLIGMFYNFFIPGGIGGDAYKVYVLNKEFKWSVKKLSTVIFIDRLVGLIAIGILINVLCFFIPIFKQEQLFWILFLALAIGIMFSYFFIKLLFPSFLSVTLRVLAKSILIQLLQSICVIFLLLSLSGSKEYLIYVLVFLVSSVLSVFSFSGIGVREMVFYQAAKLLVFDSTKAVAIGLLFSVITAFVSVFGLFFHFKSHKKPYLKKRANYYGH